MGAVEFRILGPLEAAHDGRLLPLTGTRQRVLLAILLLHAGEVVSTDRLLEAAWGDDPPDAGATALRVRISQLRRALGPAGELLVTRSPGYVMALGVEQLDLRRFERMVQEGERALERDDAATAAEALRGALGLWRGPPLGDFAYAPFAQAAIARLDDLRLAATELRVDAELRLGRHAGLVGELRALVREHPLRERPCGQLMLALYRDGRQAEALEVYRAAHRRLADEVGLEPGPELQELERQILAQDPALRRDRARSAPPRTILAVPAAAAAVEAIVELARPLALGEGHELLVALLVEDERELAAATAALNATASQAVLRGAVRVTAFTSRDRAADAVRLATDEEAAVLLLDASRDLSSDGTPSALVRDVLGTAVCDVALVAGAPPTAVSGNAPVLVPFGGHQHDWGAVELGAWYANATGAPLRLVGTRADPRSGRRDASRLLASASIAVQRALGVTAEPMLVEPGAEGVLDAVEGAALVVAGLSDRWAREGVGAARLELARRSSVPVLLVRRGLRPGGLAPPRALTRFTWSAG